MSSPHYDLYWIEFYKDNQGYAFREQGPCRIANHGSVFFSQLSSKSYNRKHGPAMISCNGTVRYNNEQGKYHRLSGPAIIWATGKKEYWVDNEPLSPDEFFLKYGVV